MKLLNKFLLTFFVGAALTACDREYVAPPLDEPHYNGPEANITIKELKDRYQTPTTEPNLITEDLVLKGYITGNDVSGNIYKKLYIQDETAAIEMEIDFSNAATKYRVGQQVYIDLKGLGISFYRNEMQLGLAIKDSARIPQPKFEEVVHLNGWPDLNNVVPEEISDFGTIAANAKKYEYRLVTLKNVYFVNGGKATFSEAESSGIDQVIKDENGAEFIVRTSGYADFALDRLPVGKGNLTGILARYNGKFQFTIRSREDISGFSDTPISDNTDSTTPSVDGIAFQAPFASGNDGFTEEVVQKDANLNFIWKVDTQRKYLKGSAYVGKTNLAGEARFVSPVIDLKNINQPVIQFEHVVAYLYSDKATDHFALEIREAGNSNWTKLNVANFPNNKDWTFEPARVDISAYKGKKVQIAFYYKSTTTTAPTWEIKNVQVGESTAIKDVTGGSTTNPGTTDPGTTTPVANALFAETFSKVTAAKSENKWPTIAEFKGFDNPASMFEVKAGNPDVRNISNRNNIWFPANKDEVTVAIKGISSQGVTQADLEIEVGVNVYSDSESQDLNTLEVYLNGKKIEMPSKVINKKADGNQPFPLKVSGVQLQESNTLEFKAIKETNTKGLRLFSVKLLKK